MTQRKRQSAEAPGGRAVTAAVMAALALHGAGAIWLLNQPVEPAGIAGAGGGMGTWAPGPPFEPSKPLPHDANPGALDAVIHLDAGNVHWTRTCVRWREARHFFLSLSLSPPWGVPVK